MGLTGRLEGFGLPELLQILAQSKKSGTLTLRGGSIEGTITLLNGRLAAVSADMAAGEEALFALLGNMEGHFSFVPSIDANVEHGLPEELSESLRPLDVLLLEASAGDVVRGQGRVSEGGSPTRTGGR